MEGTRDGPPSLLVVVEAVLLPKATRADRGTAFVSRNADLWAPSREEVTSCE